MKITKRQLRQLIREQLETTNHKVVWVDQKDGGFKIVLQPNDKTAWQIETFFRPDRPNDKSRPGELFVYRAGTEDHDEVIPADNFENAISISTSLEMSYD